MRSIRRTIAGLALAATMLLGPLAGASSAGGVGGQFCRGDTVGGSISHGGTLYTCGPDGGGYNRWLPAG